MNYVSHNIGYLAQLHLALLLLNHCCVILAILFFSVNLMQVRFLGTNQDIPAGSLKETWAFVKKFIFKG